MTQIKFIMQDSIKTLCDNSTASFADLIVSGLDFEVEVEAFDNGVCLHACMRACAYLLTHIHTYIYMYIPLPLICVTAAQTNTRIFFHTRINTLTLSLSHKRTITTTSHKHAAAGTGKTPSSCARQPSLDCRAQTHTGAPFFYKTL